jgi:hypothetical protein
MSDQTPTTTGPPEGTAHSHADPYDPAKHSVATVTHPATGQTASFTYPADNTDQTIRFEFPDGTKGEHPNPNAAPAVDADSDDVIWDGATGTYMRRVLSAETGTSAETASESGSADEAAAAGAPDVATT